MEISPYLNFDGTCEEAMRFYERVLGGRIEALSRFEGSPAAGDPAMNDRILHARMTVGNQVIMASDAPPGYYSRPAGSYISLTPDSLEDARRIFDALSEGGSVHMPFEPTFWSPGFGMFADRYGTLWMVSAPHK